MTRNAHRLVALVAAAVLGMGFAGGGAAWSAPLGAGSGPAVGPDSETVLLAQATSAPKPASAATAKYPVYDQRQCVKNIFGTGIVAKVKWYTPDNVVADLNSKTVVIATGAKPMQEDSIAVLQTSCAKASNKTKLFAEVSVVGSEFVNTSISVAVGTVVTVAAGAACIGSEGTLCGAVIPGAVAVISGSVSFLPQAKDTFYAGSPGTLEVSGTAWTPKATEVRAFGTGLPVGASCEKNADCSNSACGRVTAADNTPLTCCPVGSSAKPYAGYDYCNQMANGSVCWSDAQCGSGNCKGNANGLKKGKCS